MTVRNLLSAAAFSVTILAAGAGFAAGNGGSGMPEGFSAQLTEAKGALIASNSASVGREERIEADQYVAMAESLWNNGASAQAQQFLNFARGTLGLDVQPPDISLVERVTEQNTSIR